MKRNRRHVEAHLGSRLTIDAAVPAALVGVLFEAETSGGLLFSVEPGRAADVTEEFRRGGEACWEIGEVVREPVIRVTA